MENPQKQPDKSSPAKKQLIVIFLLATVLFIGIIIKAAKDYHWWLPETEIVSTLHPEDLKQKIDINAAPWYEIVLLPKLGEVKARAIIAYREKHGRFKSLDELRQINGIGKNIINSLKGYVIVGTGSTHNNRDHF